ncbi:phosphonoacetaldehyde hydrolase [Limnohabitans sp. 2KL-1]|uniref:phosphonoacetaldehyde hydrolase n=1 Tax=Limnohabitans sp. 2KL-1 TaxID=1100699 RepID=UPI000D389E07|nr:phosphonoacetaldehyde hydrolase [Limnohabitans sp. 2KL-1]PUE47972.1 phosphonoacetaldehyde hydrolase [Limnohabitans sp. 2KL-1]
MNKIKGVILDWAGTIVDFGSLAPMGAFVELFARHRIQISFEQARVPMGLPKIDHIIALGQMPDIAAQWQAVVGRPFEAADARNLLDEFEPMSAQAALNRSAFIPGFMPVYQGLKAQGLAFATTTGYTRKIMTPLIEQAHAQGFEPARVICCDDVARSRPDPMGVEQCLQAMHLQGQSSQVIKVDDTAPGLAEGLAAGCWTVGVAASGNALGWTYERWQQAQDEEKTRALQPAVALLEAAGAHEVIDSVADLPEAIARIEQRMGRGETP